MLSCPFDVLDRIAALQTLLLAALVVAVVLWSGLRVVDSFFFRWLIRRKG